ncbi:MAG: TatD family hydrolase [Verrucomicrobiae bacterium]|nr:TatD family hydrolase [Verrucomicrobiae bacterium]MCP5550507.1 TatD family hydrolase [Akkermansiaceae bacterium]
MIDAHLHPQDPRLASSLEGCLAEARAAGVDGWIGNGTSEADWAAVADLARRWPGVHPCFGLHPWYVRDRSDRWEARLREFLAISSAVAVGEIGLDKWMRDPRIEDQEIVFRAQLRLAKELDLPAVIHCLKAWGRLLDVLGDEGPPPRGFLLHSHAGPAEMTADFLALGARFSFSGHFLAERKSAVREIFRTLPEDRILVETDAPDMRLPEELDRFRLQSPAGEPLNHPANLAVIARELARLRETPWEDFVRRLDANARRLFFPDDAKAAG